MQYFYSNYHIRYFIMFALKDKHAEIYIFKEQSSLLILRYAKNLTENKKFKENYIQILIQKIICNVIL